MKKILLICFVMLGIIGCGFAPPVQVDPNSPFFNERNSTGCFQTYQDIAVDSSLILLRRIPPYSMESCISHQPRNRWISSEELCEEVISGSSTRISCQRVTGDPVQGVWHRTMFLQDVQGQLIETDVYFYSLRDCDIAGPDLPITGYCTFYDLAGGPILTREQAIQRYGEENL